MNVRKNNCGRALLIQHLFLVLHAFPGFQLSPTGDSHRHMKHKEQERMRHLCNIYL